MSTELKITANYGEIAKGIFAMLQDLANKGDESYLTALAFGMLPAPFMEMAEKTIIEKLAEQYDAKWGIPIARARAAVKEDYKREISDFNHHLALAILNEAKINQNLVV